MVVPIVMGVFILMKLRLIRLTLRLLAGLTVNLVLFSFPLRLFLELFRQTFYYFEVTPLILTVLSDFPVIPFLGILLILIFGPSILITGKTQSVKPRLPAL